MVTILVLVGVFIAGIVWVVWWVADNIDAPGPAATGNGPCGAADSVNLQLVFVDGHTVQACTRDRPDCPNHTVFGTNASQFSLNNQLRSSSRRYIISVQFDAALPADIGEQTLTLEPGPGFMPGEQGSGTLIRALIHITPRDPTEDGYTTASGSIVVSSASGVARGRIDGAFSTGGTRPDRSAPTPTAVSPIRIAGTFVCNH